MKSFSGSFAYDTDKGLVRQDNEDQACALLNGEGEILLIVCDGMGGQNKGDYASKFAIDCFVEAFKHKRKYKLVSSDKIWVSRIVKKINSSIYSKGEKDAAFKGMGTTFLAAIISGEKLLLTNMGDSRAYMATKDNIKQISEDQTLVRFLVSTGKISEEEALVHPDRHVLNNALGIYPSVSLDFQVFKYNGEKILLCTDGLYNQVSLEDIHAHMFTNERSEQKINALIKEAEMNGGSDNVGIVLWEADIDD